MSVPKEHLSRRRFGAMTAGALAACAFGPACEGSYEYQLFDGRLKVRPHTGAATSAAGDRALGLDPRRDAILHVPANAGADPLPLLVLLHGASGNGEGILRRIGGAIEDTGVAVVAPSSRDGTWDGIRGGFGPDVAMLDRVLARVFETVAVDAARVAIGGFSDGATYALSLGLINGDLFGRIVAFSPGFIVGGEAHGKPRLFISHGTSDQILPIDQTSRAIVPDLRRRGYDVTYREFEGRHEVPAAIAHDALAWVAAP
jgi:phospholipase/carboxylesterase